MSITTKCILFSKNKITDLSDQVSLGHFKGPTKPTNTHTKDVLIIPSIMNSPISKFLAKFPGKSIKEIYELHEKKFER